MILVIVNGAAFILVLFALMITIRRPLHGTEEGRAVLILLGALVLLSCVGLIRRTGHAIADDVALAGWTVVAAVAVWVITRRA